MSKLNAQHIPFDKVASYFSLIAGVCIVVLQIISLVGITDMPFLNAKLPSITVLLCGMILAYLGIEYQTILRKIHKAVETHQLESIAALYDRVDPDLATVFGYEVHVNLSAVKEAIENKRITIYDRDRFEGYYRKLLDLYPRSTFHATGLPYERYFWNDDNQRMIADFIANGGKFLRVFYLSEPDWKNDNVMAILDAQCKMGVEVYTCDSETVAAVLNPGHYFIAETKMKVGWELNVNATQRMTKVTATANKADLARYLAFIDDLKRSGATRRYKCREEASSPAQH